MAASKKAVEMNKKFIVNEIAAKMNDTKVSHTDLAIASGYSESVAKDRNVRDSKIYVDMVNNLTDKLGMTLFEYVESVERDVQNGVIEKQSFDQKIKQMSTIVSIFKAVSPTFKQKKTVKNDEGYETTWTTLN